MLHEYKLNYFRSVLKGYNFILPLSEEPEQQRFTAWSGVLTSISSRRRSAINGDSLPEWTDFVAGTRSLQLDRATHAQASHTMTFTLPCSPATTHYFSSHYYQVLNATHLPTLTHLLVGSTPGRSVIKSTKSIQPSIPPGWVNRVPCSLHGWG